jgi:type VI secretion system protein ImpL
VSTAVVEINRDAQALPPGIASVVTRVTDGTAAAVRGGARNDLMTRYQQSVVGPCNDIARGKYPFVAGSAQDVTPSDFGRLFASGGIYDAFFRSEMAPLVVPGRMPLAWTSDATGASVGGTPQMLTRFEAAQRIRDVFFASGQEPQLRFTLTPVDLDAGAQRFTLEVDGQTLEYRHAAPRPVPMQWPGPKPNLVVATFEERTGARPNVVFEGPWAWLRFLDVAKPAPDGGSEVRFTLTIGAGAHEAHILLEVPSRTNPYRQRDVLQFRCE